MSARYYLAGPMQGMPDWGYPEFARVAALLRAQGVDVMSADGPPDPAVLRRHRLAAGVAAQ
jgi:hypothetical protein